MNLTKKRWIILFTSCLINLCIGSTYAWSVFSTPMAEYLSEINGLTGTLVLTASSLAMAFTLCNAVGPITMILGGSFNDKMGPKWVIFIGGLLFSGGLLGAGFATNISMLVLFYGLGCGLGMGMVYGCTVSNSIKFFPDKRGLIGGIATATYGLSSVIVSPIANTLIGNVGVASAFRILGIAFIIIICGGAFLIDKCPVGFVPDGYQPPITEGANGSKTVDKNWNQMLKDPIFYVMIGLLVCGAFCGLMVISQASPMVQNIVGVSTTVAATAVSVLALFNTFGRLCAGGLSDKIGRINTLTIAFVLSIAGLMILYVSKEGSLALFMIGLSIVGMAFGSLMGVFPGFTADQFGTKNNSVNYGIMFIGFAVAGCFGPIIVGNIFSAYNSYKYAFAIAMVLAACGIGLSYVYRYMSKK